MDVARHLHTQRQVGPLFVVCPYRVLCRFTCFLLVGERGIQQVFCFEDPVYPLSHCVVVAVARLAHAGPYPGLLQYADIGLAAVLEAPVRVVDKTLWVRALSNRHLQCFHCPFGFQRAAKVPADDLPAVGVRGEEKVAERSSHTDVGYIRNPGLAGGGPGFPVEQVSVLAVPHKGLGSNRVPPFRPHQQPLGTQQLKEPVPAHPDAEPVKIGTDHGVQLPDPDPGVDGTVFPYQVKDQALFRTLPDPPARPVVKCRPAVAKVGATRFQAHLPFPLGDGTLPKFFFKSVPYSSLATLISVSSIWLATTESAKADFSLLFSSSSSLSLLFSSTVSILIVLFNKWSLPRERTHFWIVSAPLMPYFF